MGTKEQVINEIVRLPFDHPIFKERDHHIMRFMRALADDTDLGTIKIRVPAADRMWQLAFELGIEHGCALAEAALRPKPKGKGAV